MANDGKATTNKARLARAIEALAAISFLDRNAAAQLSDAVALAENALRDIDRDHLMISLDVKNGGRLTIHVASAAGNDALVREVAPKIQALFDAAAVAVNGKPLIWKRQADV